MRDGGGYAFPSEHPFLEGGPGAIKWYTGMSVRQYYKARAEEGAIGAWFSSSDSERKALSGCVDSATIMQRDLPRFIAKVTALIADAMIAEDREAEKVQAVSAKEEPQKVEAPESETTRDCLGCGNFFVPDPPEAKKCMDCRREDVEQAHDAGECVKDCPICAEEKLEA